jgi:DegV family protein with EDD domain
LLLGLGAHGRLIRVVAVVTDSAANLPAALAGELRIEVVPMYLMLGDVVYRDGVDLAPADLYSRLSADGVVATTSTPSPADFLEAFKRTGSREIVCVTVASSMSSAHHEAGLAAQRFEGSIEVVDSMNATMAQGFVALEAARCAVSGGSLAEAAGRARDLAARTQVIATIATFEFLRRSGRVKKLQAYAATMLDIKPVFGFSGGEAAAIGRPRTRRRALARVLEETLRSIGERPGHVAAVHAAAEGEAGELLAQIEGRADVVERMVVPVTPVIGVHTGPGLVGTAFYTD